MALPSVDDIFKRGIELTQTPLPLEPAESRQPDTVRGVGELQPHSEPPAKERLADSSSAFIIEEPVDAEAPETTEAAETTFFIQGRILGNTPLLEDPAHPGQYIAWAYAWEEATPDPNDQNTYWGISWVQKPGGINWVSYSNASYTAYAYNTVEHRNLFIPTKILHGYDIIQTGAPGGDIILELLPIPNGTPILLRFEQRTFNYGVPPIPDTWMISFSEPGAVEQIVCP